MSFGVQNSPSSEFPWNMRIEIIKLWSQTNNYLEILQSKFGSRAFRTRSRFGPVGYSSSQSLILKIWFQKQVLVSASLKWKIRFRTEILLVSSENPGFEWEIWFESGFAGLVMRRLSLGWKTFGFCLNRSMGPVQHSIRVSKCLLSEFDLFLRWKILNDVSFEGFDWGSQSAL